MIRITKKIKNKEDDVIQWRIQAVNITTNLRVKIDLTLPEFKVKQIVMQNCHVDDYSKGRYDMILGRSLLIVL